MIHGNCAGCGHMLALVGTDQKTCLVNKCDCTEHDFGRAIGGRCNKCKHPYHIGRCPVWRLDRPKRCACVHNNQGET